MSYIINNSSAFVNIKLTETGRQKLAQGKLNFTSSGIGDSEINYDREDVHDDNLTDISLSGSSRILRPMDRQPNIKYFITANSNNNDNLNTLNSSQITTIKAIVNNTAKERGFFSADTTHSNYITYTGDTYIKAHGSISGATITGGTSLVIGTGYTYQVGDFLLLKVNNDTVGTLSDNQNTTPIPYLWYKIQSQTTTINLNDTYEFRIYLHFIFLNNNTNKWEYVYKVEYADKSLSKEDLRKLEERKNVLLFSLISIVIFSIISVVVNIKRLTEKPKRKEES